MSDGDIPIQEAADRASVWLYDEALPLWLERGVDWGAGGFYESLSHDTLEGFRGFKRLRVLARQIYVFSEGSLYGVDHAREAVDFGLKFLFDQARHPEGGFASRQDMTGRIIDEKRDLYDLAFVLFALAHAYRVTQASELRAEAILLLGFLKEKMSHPAGGFVESLPNSLPRRQNPHMHLLEASLAAAEHFGDAEFVCLVDDLVCLAVSRFVSPDGNALFEYFNDGLTQPDRTSGRALMEPGHHMEWAWLFTEVARVKGEPPHHLSESLALSALSLGLDPETGFLFGEVYEGGKVAVANVRLWPHGEWLKAAVRIPAISSTWRPALAAINRFLDVPVRGLWREQWLAERGGFAAGPAPASSLYHITTAITELRRVAKDARSVGTPLL